MRKKETEDIKLYKVFRFIILNNSYYENIKKAIGRDYITAWVLFWFWRDNFVYYSIYAFLDTLEDRSNTLKMGFEYFKKDFYKNDDGFEIKEAY